MGITTGAYSIELKSKGAELKTALPTGLLLNINTQACLRMS